MEVIFLFSTKHLIASFLSLLLVVIFFVIALFGANKLFNKCFVGNRARFIEVSMYSSIRDQLLSEYDRTNPITQEKSTINYLDYLKKANVELKEEDNLNN